MTKANDAAFAYGCVETAIRAIDCAIGRIFTKRDENLLFKARHDLDKVTGNLQTWLRKEQEKENKK